MSDTNDLDHLGGYTDKELRAELELRYEPTAQEKIAWEVARNNVISGSYTFCAAPVNENWPADVLSGIYKSAVKASKDADQRLDNYMAMVVKGR